ncbi:MAG: UDP-2,3-diacylglucosamine diphosphatase [Bacteroidales bacterium]|nr:UDP-2,3-diacylglucosamine diphosphatase [Bacteroidales bacterium]
MADRSLTFFASDVHLGLNVADPAAREARFTAFLKAIPAERTEALYLLGDIWDFWYEYKHVVPKGYVKVFAALTELIEKGVRVYFFPGNHDIWAYHYFESLGITVVRDRWLITEIGGKTFCLSHGDGLGRGMYGYKFMRAIFHGRFFQVLFSTLHPRLAFGIGQAWSRRSRLAKRHKYVFKGEKEPLYEWASEMADRQKTDYFIFGHYHCPYSATLPSGAEFILLEDWMEGSPYLCFSPSLGMSGSLPNME